MNPKTGAVLIGIGVFLMLLFNVRWGEVSGMVRAYTVVGMGVVTFGAFFTTLGTMSETTEVGSDVVYHVAGGIAAAVLVGSFFAWIGGVPFWDVFEDVGASASRDFQLGSEVLVDDSAILVVNVGSLHITVAGWGNAEVSANGTLKMYGLSEEKAKEHLNETDVVLLRGEREGKAEFVIQVKGLSSSIIGGRNYRLYLTVFVPQQVKMDLDLRSASGDVDLVKVKVGDGRVRTSSGSMNLIDVVGDSFDASVVSGSIKGSVSFEEASFSAVSGRVELELPRRSGAYELRSMTGGVIARIPEADDLGVSFRARTTTGGVTVDLASVEYDEERSGRKEGQTSGFSEKEFKIELDARTTSGSVRILSLEE